MKRYSFVVLALIALRCSAKSAFSKNEQDNLDWFETPALACSGCSGESAEDDLIQLRLEMIKQQILSRLRLKERPIVALPKGGLPTPVANGFTQDIDNESLQPAYDDYYGRTEQKIIFPSEAPGECSSLTRWSSACLQFDLPADLEYQDVSKAELWFFKEADILDEYNQTFMVSEAAHWDNQHKFRKTKPIAIYETSVREGWLRVDVAWTVKQWLEKRELRHSVHVACRTCATRPPKAPLSLRSKDRPFLVININHVPKRRQKRHLECIPGMSECCRESLYVKFADIKWHDWIIHPPGYHAYFCRGECSSIPALAQASPHSSLWRKVLDSFNANKKLEMRSCCAPTRFSSLQILYMEANNTVNQHIIPNMVVEACGCM